MYNMYHITGYLCNFEVCVFWSKRPISNVLYAILFLCDCTHEGVAILTVDIENCVLLGLSHKINI